MGELVRLVIDTIAYVWPFRIVRPWERAGFMVLGKWWKEIGPGLYIIVPFFMDVHAVSVAEAIAGTPRLDITLTDGRTLSFSATCTAHIEDVRKAVCDVDDFATTTQELLASVLADKLADVDVERLSPQKRGRLFADLRRWVADEAAKYGVAVTAIRFTSFVVGARTYRHLVDQSQPAAW